MEDTELQYVVRKSWEDIESQVGIAYNFLINAQKACDKLEGYFVFDSNGNAVYPEVAKMESEPIVATSKTTVAAEKELIIGDDIQLLPNAHFANGRELTDELLSLKLFIRDIKPNGYVVARTKKGPTLGTVNASGVMKYSGVAATMIEPYLIQVPNSNVAIHAEASLGSKIIKMARKFDLYTIINEKNNMGKLKNNGWIDLNKVDKLK